MSHVIKVFDSLVHSGINPEWPSKPEVDVSINAILSKLERENSLIGACIQTSPWFDSADSNEIYIANIKSFKTSKLFVPVFTIPSATSSAWIKEKIKIAIDCGFSVFKVHPRFSNLSLSICIDVIEYLASSKFFVQVCCYPYDEYNGSNYRINNKGYSNLLESLCRISNKYCSYICLMHGFGTQILNAHNVVRHNKYLLLDLSMTMMKYEGSSIDMDISFLFRKFDRRIVIGSDYPEWTYHEFLKRTLKFADGIEINKRDNITHLNLLQALHHGSNSAL